MMDSGARPRSRTCIALMVALGLLASACQSATSQSAMPIEEAKRITEAVSGAAFVPPPRTIKDITTILDQQKRTAPGALTLDRVDEAPPNTTDRDALAQFYFKRGMAAREVGRARQEIDDLTRAWEYARSGSSRTHVILWELSHAELRGGKFARAIEYRRKAIAAVPKDEPGWLIPLNSALASAYADLGDLKAADSALAETTRVFHESQGWQNQRPEWIASRQAQLAKAQAALPDARGRYVEAEAAYRRVAAILAGNSVYARHTWLDETHHYIARTLIRQGRLIEAEYEARKALLGALAKRGRYSNHTAWILQQLVSVLREQGRYRESETLARALVDIYEKSGATPESMLFAHARAHLLMALELQSRYQEALAEYEAIGRGLGGDPQSIEKVLGDHLGNSAVLLRSGHVDRALERFGIACRSISTITASDRSTTSVFVRAPRTRCARRTRSGSTLNDRWCLPIDRVPRACSP